MQMWAWLSFDNLKTFRIIFNLESFQKIDIFKAKLLSFHVSPTSSELQIPIMWMQKSKSLGF